MAEMLFAALFCFGMAFVILGCLAVLVGVFTDIIRFVEDKNKAKK